MLITYMNPAPVSLCESCFLNIQYLASVITTQLTTCIYTHDK